MQHHRRSGKWKVPSFSILEGLPAIGSCAHVGIAGLGGCFVGFGSAIGDRACAIELSGIKPWFNIILKHQAEHLSRVLVRLFPRLFRW